MTAKRPLRFLAFGWGGTALGEGGDFRTLSEAHGQLRAWGFPVAEDLPLRGGQQRGCGGAPRLACGSGGQAGGHGV